jgi:hypothetical protein
MLPPEKNGSLSVTVVSSSTIEPTEIAGRGPL